MRRCQKEALETIVWSHWGATDEANVRIHCDLYDKSGTRYAAVILSKVGPEMSKPTSDDLKRALLWRLCGGCPMWEQEDDHATHDHRL